MVNILKAESSCLTIQDTMVKLSELYKSLTADEQKRCLEILRRIE